MNKLHLFFILFFIVSCGKTDVDSPTTNPPPTNGNTEKPVAVNDNFSATEETTLVTGNVLSNDTTPAGTQITSFDATSVKNGEVINNRNGSFNYVPANAFAGTDSFTYTICDNQSPQNCATATVSISVADEGSPQAAADAVQVVQNTALTITDLLDNDDLSDDAQITSVDGSASSGNVVLNADGSVSYTPLTDSSANDSFSYTICDDDSPTQTCSTATVDVTVLEPIAFNIPENLSEYYSSVVFSSDTDSNLTTLKNLTVTKHTVILTYFQRHTYLYDADEDPSNQDNVILMYSGESRYWKEYSSPSNSYSPQTFNTEHVYPQSKLNNEDSKTDLHHLRVCDESINTSRGNVSFVNGSGAYNKTSSGWYPGDQWKGDVARMIFYLNIRYGEVISDVGDLEVLLTWNIEDPVSAFEINRNNVFEAAQGNRNPFIDNPYLATLVWGGAAAENKWE